MKKKVLSVLLSVAMVSSLLIGCGSSAADTNKDAATEETAAPEEEKTEDTKADDAKTEDTKADVASGKTAKDYKIAIVPKMTSIAWFERMEVGINEYNEKNGTEVYYGGSTEGDGQAAYVESLLSQDYDAICVVPFDTESLEPVLKKAMDAGIKVICHEASSMTNMDYDIEAFDNAAYGEHFMKKMGELTSGKGEYVQFVGALTSTSHNEWTDAAKAYQEKNFPDMALYGDKIESSDDQDIAYNKAKEVLTANPNVAAIQGSAMGDVAGIARAVEELGLKGKVKIVGTSLASVSGKYVEDGVIDMISFWDPALAGQAMVELAVAALNGTADDKLTMDINGYDTLTLKDNVYYASAWIDLDAGNVADYDF